ncbi:GNAT family N-acetyltransferase [Nocardia sp. NPDC003963]
MQLPAWRIWLARIDREPVGAACIYYDGKVLGAYWVATLREQRFKGIARGLMSTALAAYPDSPATLLATAAGRPLYESMHFGTVREVTWVRGKAS